MNKYEGLLNALNKTKWWILLLLFNIYIINSFKTEIKYLINYKLLNKDVIIERLDSDVLIEDALYNLMERAGADRAYIFRFHNGVNYYNGEHKSKMSCDFEVTRAGISSEAQRLQDIPVGLYANWIRDVINYKMIHPDVNKIKGARIRLELQRQGIEAIAVIPYYRNGKILALIGVDYVSPLDNVRLRNYLKDPKGNLERFKAVGNEIGDLLR
jgi:hypothetical protein